MTSKLFIGRLIRHAVTRDPKDDYYLVALAREAGVDAIANGDDDPHAARDLDIEALTSRELLTRLGY
jgi:predicted nucleic acid-binding protein